MGAVGLLRKKTLPDYGLFANTGSIRVEIEGYMFLTPEKSRTLENGILIFKNN